MKSVFLILMAIFYLFLNKIDCQIKNRIVGGKSGKISDFPYLVSINYLDEHICGGSYIRDRWVLTAAHCFFKTRDQVDRPLYVCIMGRTTLNDTGKQVQQSEVLYEIEHADYNEETNENDIALMFLKKGFRRTANVRFVDLARRISYKNCIVVGWAMETDEDRPVLSYELKWASVPIFAKKQCSEEYPEDYQHFFDGDKTVCTTYTGGSYDVVQGESGGPLVCNGKLFGIVAWGIQSASEFPGIYTSIPAFRRWIDKAMKQPQRKLKKRSGSDFHHTVSDRGYQILPTSKYTYIVLLMYIAV